MYQVLNLSKWFEHRIHTFWITLSIRTDFELYVWVSYPPYSFIAEQCSGSNSLILNMNNYDYYYKIFFLSNFVQQDARMLQLNDAMRNGMSDLDRLRDLQYHAGQVLVKLHVGIKNTVLQKKVDRYKVSSQRNVHSGFINTANKISSFFPKFTCKMFFFV